jgi:hypothetical protein
MTYSNLFNKFSDYLSMLYELHIFPDDIMVMIFVVLTVITMKIIHFTAYLYRQK